MSTATTTCTTPECDGDPVEGKRICQPCVERLTEIRKDFENNPKSIFMQRSDQRHKQRGPGKQKQIKVPTCSRVGCFTPRESGEPFCGGQVCYDE